jgi:D-serine dehydratase
MMKDKENIKIEPSATPGLLGPLWLEWSNEGRSYVNDNGLRDAMKNSTHIAWATGGLFVPEEMMKEFYDRGKKELGKL